jgi:hypothetical protein
MAYPISSIHFLISPDFKAPKKAHASVTTNIGPTSRLVTHRLWPCLRGIHLDMFATVASSRRRFARNRGSALYCTAHHYGNCAAAHAGHEETVGSRGDNMYVLPLHGRVRNSDSADFSQCSLTFSARSKLVRVIDRGCYLRVFLT